MTMKPRASTLISLSCYIVGAGLFHALTPNMKLIEKVIHVLRSCCRMVGFCPLLALAKLICSNSLSVSEAVGGPEVE